MTAIFVNDDGKVYVVQEEIPHEEVDAAASSGYMKEVFPRVLDETSGEIVYDLNTDERAMILTIMKESPQL